MESAARITAISRFLRRTKSRAELEALALATFTNASSPVTLTSLGFEGGTGTGVVTMEPAELLAAIEQTLSELEAADPTSTSTTPLSERTSAYVRHPASAFRAGY